MTTPSTPAVDLRSDTLTRPTAGMRRAMVEAEVGDDMYGEDPTVAALQARVAGLLGHEAALFVPSGTMGNQIGVQVLVPAGQELICDAEAHLVTYESGAAAAFGGISTRTWQGRGGQLDVDEIMAMVRPEGYYTVPTRAIAVEQTGNRAGGTVIDIEVLRRLRAAAEQAGVAMHCDGARLWNAHVATGVPLAEYGRLFETVSVCLSKGLGAPVGSLVVASAGRIEAARRVRQRMGGAMRQSGILAAAGLYALDNHLDRLAVDHARAARLAEAMAAVGACDPQRVATNIVPVDLGPSGWLAPRFAAAAAELGVRVSAFGPTTVRLVTHLDVDDDGVETAIGVLTGLLSR